jgi:hypothetical protein
MNLLHEYGQCAILKIPCGASEARILAGMKNALEAKERVLAILASAKPPPPIGGGTIHLDSNKSDCGDAAGSLTCYDIAMTLEGGINRFEIFLPASYGATGQRLRRSRQRQASGHGTRVLLHLA